MANQHAHGSDVVDQTVQHEESDVDIRAIFGFGIGLFVVGAVVHVAIYLLFLYFSSGQQANRVRQYPLAAGQENRLPPEPRLQTNPRQDLQDLRAQEEQLLNGYSWVDRNAGVVRIPIAEAMRLTLQRGLPSRSAQPTGQAAAPPAAGRTAPPPPGRQSAPAPSRRPPAPTQGKRR
jgi:hypothetical protein